MIAGADRARADAVHGDALAAEFDRERARQAGDAGLRRGIGAVQRGGAERFGGGDIDDPRAFRFAQMRQRGADDARMRRQHHGECPWPRPPHNRRRRSRRAREMPALLTTMSSPPKCAATSSTTDGDVVAVGDVERPGLCRAAFGCDLTGNGLRRLGVRSVTATLAPSAANTCAVARPMPLAAPVTRTVRPLTERLSCLKSDMMMTRGNGADARCRIDKAGTDPQTGQTKQQRKVQTVTEYSRCADQAPGDAGCRPLPGHPAGGAATKSRSIRLHVREGKRATAVVVRSRREAARRSSVRSLRATLVGMAGYCRAGERKRAHKAMLWGMYVRSRRTQAQALAKGSWPPCSTMRAGAWRWCN